MNVTRILMIATIAAAASAFVGCTRTVVYKERDPDVVVVTDAPGPPPHAPAHGYRLKHAHDNVELVYDSDVDVYVVVGYENCYFSAGQYFRFVASTWEWSVGVEGPWKVVVHESDVPPGLCHRHGKGHGKKRDHDD